MSMSEADARRLINAMQTVVENYSTKVHDDRNWAIQTLPGWVSRKKYPATQKMMLTSMFAAKDCGMQLIELCSGVELMFEGLIWIAAEQKGRGFGAFEAGVNKVVDTAQKLKNTWIGVCEGANKSGVDLDLFFLNSVLTFSYSGIYQQLINAKRGVSGVDVEIIVMEIEKLKPTLYDGGIGFGQLLDIFARAKYDVVEALKA